MIEFLAVYAENWANWWPQITVAIWNTLWLMVCSFALAVAIGLVLARRVQMTQMPELVAILHSLVGLAAVFVGFASFTDPDMHFIGVEQTIHDIEIYLGILIGAVTFSGSVIAFGKLSGKISGNPLILPARHWMNLGLLLITIWVGAQFVEQSAAGSGMVPLLIMTAVAFKRCTVSRALSRSRVKIDA